MDIFAKIKPIEGWLTKSESEILFKYASNTKNKGSIVEIGSWKGKSTTCLAEGLKENSSKQKILSIDPHFGSPIQRQILQKEIDTYQDFLNNVNHYGHSDVIEPLRLTSEEAHKNFKGEVELLFIDGDHEYEMVMLDFKLWSKYVINNGFLLFHDSYKPGPKKVLIRCLLLSRNYKLLNIADSLTAFQKRKKGLIDIITDLYYYLIKRSKLQQVT